MDDYIHKQAAINIICSHCAVATPQSCTTIRDGSRWCEEVYLLLNTPSADVEPVVHCRDCIFGHKCVDVTNGIITAIWVECINPDGLYRNVPCGGYCHAGIKRREENGGEQDE